MVKENNTSIYICILRLSSIGDVTHILPIISTLQNKYDNCDITWIIGKTEYQLVKELDDINFIVIDKTKTLDSFLGMHFFNPVAVMALVEIIHTVETNPSLAEFVSELVKKWGKIPIFFIFFRQLLRTQVPY